MVLWAQANSKMFRQVSYFLANAWEIIGASYYGRSWTDGGGGGDTQIWFRRNEVVRAWEVFLPPTKLFVDSSNSLNDFRRVNTNEGAVESLTYVEDPITRKKTPTAMIKVNWNAAIDKINKRIGIGIIVQDHEGVVLAAGSTTKIFLVEACIAEALATVHVLKFNL
jgi:hypothetical protein